MRPIGDGHHTNDICFKRRQSHTYFLPIWCYSGNYLWQIKFAYIVQLFY